MNDIRRSRPVGAAAGGTSKAGDSSPAFFGARAAPRGFPLHLGADPGARLSLRSLRRTLGDDAAEQVIDPTAPAAEAPTATTEANPDAPGTTRIIPSRENAGAGPGPDVMAVDTLQGDPVVNLADEMLGKIRDIMIDVRHGRIAYAVMSCGGVMGFGDRLYAVPWSALRLDAERRYFLLDITRERLLAAPGFDRDRWPSMADPLFAHAVHAYYQRPGYWEQASF